MLQRLENVYLMLLRIAVILAASLLLIGAGVCIFRSANSFLKSGRTTTPQPIHISAQKLLPEILETKRNSAEGQPTSGTPVAPSVDSNQIYYDRAATIVSSFIDKYTHGTQTISKEKLEEMIKKQAQSQDDPNLEKVYAQNFSTYISKVLTNRDITVLASYSSPDQVFQILGKAIGAFDTDFTKQVTKQQAERDTERQEAIAEKAEGLQLIYIAAGCLGTFLLVVFLFIFIRIERSLRNLAPSREMAASHPSLV
ncbi:MAG TPA: hypothetical protein VFT88_12195 [Acidobacteriaceae bacterium]|nr:hypothetical protein [Acidobacteriaceae bacterium]